MVDGVAALGHACGMKSQAQNYALLLLRVGSFLLLALGHGVQKWDTMMTRPEVFPDPLGIGHVPALICAMGAECVMSLMVAVGLFTRLSCLPIIFTMTMVALVVHHGDPWPKTEPSVLFLLIYAGIALAGPGPFSLDAWRKRRAA